jgi:hypothetical protein
MPGVARDERRQLDRIRRLLGRSRRLELAWLALLSAFLLSAGLLAGSAPRGPDPRVAGDAALLGVTCLLAFAVAYSLPVLSIRYPAFGCPRCGGGASALRWRCGACGHANGPLSGALAALTSRGRTLAGRCGRCGRSPSHLACPRCGREARLDARLPKHVRTEPAAAPAPAAGLGDSGDGRAPG